ncbi:hypothetical protein U9M48_007765 [Paspalum notatum var. saurae]|uniref:Amine oxidase domain-containing protein n=1 Tax=Paspalum notatum var. saurae TaxID=547442 RepID=A0AAQ3WC16_PASNO
MEAQSEATRPGWRGWGRPRRGRGRGHVRRALTGREMKVAVVGAGVAGLAAAHELARSGGGALVTLYEKQDHLGGHACRTVDVDDGSSSTVRLDLGFMVFNQVTSPNLMAWFEALMVEVERSDMSFSVSTTLDGDKGFEWGSRTGISGLLTQKRNSLSSSFWCMILEIFKFKKHVVKFRCVRVSGPVHHHHRLGFPAFFVLLYCRDNHLLEVREELESLGCQIKTSCKVKSVSSLEGGYKISEVDGSEDIYDQIMFGVNAPDALKILGAEATHDEMRILCAFQYTNSDVYLHRDESFMPQNSSAWSAKNFLGTKSRGPCVTYWLNMIQNIEASRSFFCDNPHRVPNHVLHKWHTSYPTPSVGSAKASLELSHIQGKRGLWFCGSYQGYGFHEDGVKAGKVAAKRLLGKKCDLLVNPKVVVPSWTEAGARLLVARFLDRFISIGNLSLIEEGGSTFSFGKACEKCHIKSVLKVHDPQFYWKVATEADIGFADAYIHGYFSFADHREGLLNLLLILIANRDAHKNSSSVASKRSYIRRGWWTPLLLTAGVASAKYILSHVSRKNTVTQTRRNISEHYDLSNNFFALFLDPTMNYSSGIFKVEGESLESAQLRKVRVLIDKANVERDHHVLDIGSGWGTLAIEVVKRTGCKYTGITLSEEQLKYAQRKVKEAGLEDRITFLLCDYRKIPIEMIEHVGHEYMDEFFRCCEYHLAEHVLFVLQFISIPEERYEEYRRSSDFIKEYIFPGCCIPSLARITSAMSNATRLWSVLTTTIIEHVENIGYHYYTTLMCWRDNFMSNRDKVLALGFDEKSIRTWEYYFIYCAAGFKSRTLGDYQCFVYFKY